MNKNIQMAVVVLTTAAGTPLRAEITTFGEVGAGVEFFDQGGSALNQASFPDEPEDFRAGYLNGRFGATLDNGLTFGIDGGYRNTSLEDFVAPGQETNEGVDTAAQLTAQFGHLSEGLYVGGIAGVGQVDFLGDSTDQDVTYRLLGAGAGVERGSWAYGGSLLFMDVNATEDPETLDEAVIAKLQAEYATASGKTFFGAYALYADGKNDIDSGFGIDVVNGPGAGLYVRHKIGAIGEGRDVVLNAGLDYLSLTEQFNGSDVTIDSVKAYIGVQITFGGSKTPRVLRVAAAPDTTFAQMLTPIVD